MKSIILSCTPAECEKIVNGDMSILVRKKVPKETAFKVYVYCTKGKPYLYRVDDDNNFELTNTLRPKTYEYVKDYNEQNGKVIGEFICDKVEKYEPHVILCACYEVNGAYVEEKLRYNKGTCLSYEDMVKKSNGKTLYGLHISLKMIYDEPKELHEFRACNFKSMNNTAVCGNYDCKYYQDSGSYMIPPSCAKNGCRVTRPPKNYIYVEE